MQETEGNVPEGNLSDSIRWILEVLIRGRWWIVSAACFIPLIGVAFVLKLPDRFTSEATLLVVQQQVSQRYVEPDSNVAIAAAIEALKLEVLSNDQLMKIIKDFDLYSGAEPSAAELLLSRMRQGIDIQPLETNPGRNDFSALRITFTAATPRLAQDVTGRLASLFIEQNLRTHGEQAANTTKFLSEQMDAARQRLAIQEDRMQAFKASNVGELPEQQQANMLALTEVRARLGTVTASITQAQKERRSIESSLTDRLSRLQSDKGELLRRYTDRHPDVLKKDREIQRVQAVLDRLRGGDAIAGKTEDADSTDDPTLNGFTRQAEANHAELENLSKEQEQLTTENEQYQRRLNLAPVREQQLAEILRDYNLFKQDYENLEKQKLQSLMTTSLEENQQGQQFRLVEPPNLPVKPSGPKRLRISLGVLVGGILVGIALAFTRDIQKAALHNEKAVSQAFSFPLVVGVPFVYTPAERRARAWRIAAEWLGGSAMMFATFAAEFYIFRHG